jgi:hypothetical protein
MLTLREQEGANPDTTPLLVMVKGAPERIIAMCTTTLIDGKKEPMTPEMEKEVPQSSHFHS